MLWALFGCIHHPQQSRPHAVPQTWPRYARPLRLQTLEALEHPRTQRPAHTTAHACTRTPNPKCRKAHTRAQAGARTLNGLPQNLTLIAHVVPTATPQRTPNEDSNESTSTTCSSPPPPHPPSRHQRWLPRRPPLPAKPPPPPRHLSPSHRPILHHSPSPRSPPTRAAIPPKRTRSAHRPPPRPAILPRAIPTPPYQPHISAHIRQLSHHMHSRKPHRNPEAECAGSPSRARSRRTPTEEDYLEEYSCRPHALTHNAPARPEPHHPHSPVAHTHPRDQPCSLPCSTNGRTHNFGTYKSGRVGRPMAGGNLTSLGRGWPVLGRPCPKDAIGACSPLSPTQECVHPSPLSPRRTVRG